jgi:dUTP pyrophosphatase
MGHLSVEIRRLPHSVGIDLPSYATLGAAGMDLRAAVSSRVVISPGASALIPTGLCMAVPAGYEAQVRPRSGLAVKHRVMVVNSPGTIDSDYRGELQVILGNFGHSDFAVERGDRIAQMVIAPVTRIAWHEVPELDDTHRGDGGFGSTGRG